MQPGYILGRAVDAVLSEIRRRWFFGGSPGAEEERYSSAVCEPLETRRHFSAFAWNGTTRTLTVTGTADSEQIILYENSNGLHGKFVDNDNAAKDET